MEIIPFTGTNLFKLGATEAEIKAILGEPDQRELVQFSGSTDEDIDIAYHAQGVELSFTEDDEYLLGSITFLNTDYTLFGVAYIGKTEEFLLKNAPLHKVTDLALDDNFEELNAKDYTSEMHEVSFWVQDGIVTSITLFPKYNADETLVLWP